MNPNQQNPQPQQHETTIIVGDHKAVYKTIGTDGLSGLTKLLFGGLSAAHDRMNKSQRLPLPTDAGAISVPVQVQTVTDGDVAHPHNQITYQMTFANQAAVTAFDAEIDALVASAQRGGQAPHFRGHRNDKVPA